ncbi:MAG: hypothetical protein M1343_14145 [Chloroflexi bacterium]|nr:hypothetical protein [Chloroflexota bacterium]MDA8187267.1 hypothetical protein [Dehalococcoidales bacterium]MDA8188616.1 hypothetical protein [Dehalococcoidales bacterium]
MLNTGRRIDLKITVGDICEAIQGKKLPVRQQGQWYSIKRLHLARYAAKLSQGGPVKG